MPGRAGRVRPGWPACPARCRGLARGPGAWPAGGRPVRRPAVRDVPGADLRRGRARLGRVRQLGGPARCGHPARPGRELRAGARRGRGDHDRAGRVYLAVRLGDADARLLPARRIRAEQAGPVRRSPGHVRVRQGQRGRAADRAAAPGDQVALDHAGLVRARPRRRGPHHRVCAAAHRVRGQGRPGAVPDLAAARLRRRPRPGPRHHGRGLRQRRLLRHVAHAGAARSAARLAGGRAAGARRAERAARHRPRGGAEPAVPGDRLLQHREHRAHRHRLRRRAHRRGDRGPAPGRGRAAGRHAPGGRAHRGQVLAVHLVRRDRGRNGPRRPGGTARECRGKGRRAGHPVERVRPGRGLADPGRAAAHGRLRVRVVPAGIPDAAVPGARPRLPPGARPGRRRGRPHRRLRRRHLRPPRRA